MRQLTGDLWQLADEVKPDAVAITTNGFVRKDGRAVLGRGCALEAATRYPWFPAALGLDLKLHGLRVTPFTGYHHNMPYILTAFPVKPRQVIASEFNIVRHQRFHFPPGKVAPGWAAVADLDLIKQSATQLMMLIGDHNWRLVLLPRPGVGNGGRSWEDEVKPLIEPILDDRVVVVSYK